VDLQICPAENHSHFSQSEHLNHYIYVAYLHIFGKMAVIFHLLQKKTFILPPALCAFSRPDSLPILSHLRKPQEKQSL